MTDFPAPRRIASNGIELSVHEAGPADGPAVLLVHGWPELAHSWKHQIPALAAAGYHVIAPDLRGFGGSDCPPDAADYGIDALVGDLTGLLDALGHDQAVFVGHDWGGIIVWHAAMLAADRVAGVIGVNTPHLPRGSEPPLKAFHDIGGDGHYIVRFQEEGYAERRFTGREDDFFAFMFGRPLSAASAEKALPRVSQLPRLFEHFKGRDEAEIVVPAEERAVYADAYRRTGFASTIHMYRNFDANWERMGGVDHRLAMPCLMISAERDVFLPPAMTRLMPALCKDVEMHTIEACGHWTMWEAPDRLNTLMLDWLDQRFPAKI